MLSMLPTAQARIYCGDVVCLLLIDHALVLACCWYQWCHISSCFNEPPIQRQSWMQAGSSMFFTSELRDADFQYIEVANIPTFASQAGSDGCTGSGYKVHVHTDH